MHICLLCPKCKQCIVKFHSAISEQLRLQTLNYNIQQRFKILYFKGLKFQKNHEIGFSSIMQIYTLCHKHMYPQGFTKFHLAV